jgi:glycosyltransferase involved in cell wall biosynthesis
VVHVITSLQTGGAEAMLAKLVAGAAAEGWKSLVVCLGVDGPVGARVRAAGVQTVVLGMSTRRPFPARLWAALRLVRRWKPRVIQGWMYHGNLAAWMLWLLSNRSAKLVWNIRCSLTSRADFPWMTRRVIGFCASLSNAPSAIVYNSSAAVGQHQSHGFRPRQAIVLPNGFDPDRLAPSLQRRDAARARLRVREDETLIGMIARYHPMKDFPSFVSAVSGVLRDRVKIRVLMAGPGVDEANVDLVERLAAAGLAGRVDLAGEIADVASVLPGLDVFCLSSAWGEAFPNIIGEAMACAVPCVATDVGDIREIIGQTGYVVPPRDSPALMRALSEMVSLPAAARRELGLAARGRIQSQYDIRDIVRQYLEMYSALADER